MASHRQKPQMIAKTNLNYNGISAMNILGRGRTGGSHGGSHEIIARAGKDKYIAYSYTQCS
jgi:hypothetical protein